jgi:hypothetical protein
MTTLMRPQRYIIENIQAIAKERKGKCLSREYKNNHTPLEWECEFGHVWKACFHSILNNKSWCPKCAGKMPHTIQEIKQFAQIQGGKCISEEYKNAHSPLLWECGGGHRWEASADSVINRETWCPKCKNLVKHSIQEMQLLAEEWGGKCISNEYVNAHTPLLWECAEGHRWMMSPTEVISKHSWCPICAHHIKHTIQEMKDFAESMGGKCLSDVYIDCDTKLEWECHQGHRWMAIPYNILIGKWCPYCGRQSSNSAKRLPSEKVKQCIEGKGYQWVAGEYVNNQSKLQLKCKNGHIWHVSLGNMRKRHCPQCSPRLSVRNRYHTH